MSWYELRYYSLTNVGGNNLQMQIIPEIWAQKNNYDSYSNYGNYHIKE
jgi:hypothetical protein